MTLGGRRGLERVFAKDNAENEEFIEDSKEKLRAQLERLVPSLIEAFDNNTPYQEARNQMYASLPYKTLVATLTKDERIDLHDAIDIYHDLLSKQGAFSTVPATERDDAQKEMDELVENLDDIRARLKRDDPLTQMLHSSTLGKRFAEELLPHVRLCDALERFSRAVFNVPLKDSPLWDHAELERKMHERGFSDYDQAGKKNDIWTISGALDLVNQDFLKLDPKHPYQKEDMEEFLGWIKEQHIRPADFREYLRAVETLTEQAIQGDAAKSWRRYFRFNRA
jgi:hypothetical protein